MTWITLTGVGVEVTATSSAAADPQLQFFENFPGHLAQGGISYSNSNDSQPLFSVHAVNIPLSISFNNVVIAITGNNGTFSVTDMFGLYSLNGSTLSLANSASGLGTFNSAGANTYWVSMVTSATQNISPGAWYFAMGRQWAGTAGNDGYLGNSSINPGNAIPGGFLMGRQTVTTLALPASIATSALDITGSDATRQPYIIITA